MRATTSASVGTPSGSTVSRARPRTIASGRSPLPPPGLSNDHGPTFIGPGVDACPCREADGSRLLPGSTQPRIGAPHEPLASTKRPEPEEPTDMEAFRFARPDIDDALDLEAFEAGLNGTILLPGSPGYDEARLVHHA